MLLFIILTHPIMGLYLLDYGAGNVQSLANSLTSLGHSFKWISHSDDFAKATVSRLIYKYKNYIFKILI